MTYNLETLEDTIYRTAGTKIEWLILLMIQNHILDINRIVPNEEDKSSKETTSSNSNGSDAKTYDSSQSSLQIGLEFGQEEANKEIAHQRRHLS